MASVKMFARNQNLKSSYVDSVGAVENTHAITFIKICGMWVFTFGKKIQFTSIHVLSIY